MNCAKGHAPAALIARDVVVCDPTPARVLIKVVARVHLAIDKCYLARCAMRRADVASSNLRVHCCYDLLCEGNWCAFGAEIGRVAAAWRSRRHWFGRDNNGASFGRRRPQHAQDVSAGNGNYVGAAPPTGAELLRYTVKARYSEC